ncbi:alcohol dehydrogenase [Streptomyces antnestii]|uniref:2-deoxy-scyllo-inosamine dehydrogenase n=1 Tax=Streptomyces antnestii TaxID=2494256 RepID=A0A437PF33_9ACTN|nr:zinc-binding dehydrogenase [Streptomyces sp. San01]RVU20895.1 alcohol dehydrogenase [Streptomyces sp. San01]
MSSVTPNTVRAAVQTGPGAIEFRDLPRPRTGADDGLLRIEANGLCGSDLETFHGRVPMRGGYPVVPGHEPLGIIEEIGDAAAERWGVQAGDRVALEVLVPCRACRLCLSGQYMSCRNRRATHGYTPLDREPGLWGGLAEYVYLHPNVVLHKVSSALPPEIAVMYNPLGAGVRWTAHLGQVGLGDTVLILGAGQRGIMAAAAAKAAGAATVIVTGLAADAHKLALAREFGADHTIVVDKENAEDTVARVTEITDGELADVVLEMTPMAAQPLDDALRAARHGGRIVVAGLKGGTKIPLDSDLVVNKALTLVGAYGVDSRGYAEAIRILESGRFPFAKLHTHTFELADTVKALDTLAGEIPGERAVHVAVRPAG